jgi:hypothetical protein
MQIPNREEAAMFERGEKVLCVHPGGPWYRVSNGNNIAGPRRGQICTLNGDVRHYFGADYVGLVGWGPDCWEAAYFVPLKKTQTDISVFTEILTKCPAPRPVRAPADGPLVLNWIEWLKLTD